MGDVDLLVVKADASAGGDDDAPLVEGVDELAEPRVGPR